MPCTDWSNLNHMQLGRYAEYYAKMEFTSYGFEVFTSEVDDRGIDFVCRKDGKWFEVQVKAIRKYNYVFMRKEHMDIESRERLNCILRFEDGTLPEVYIIPATAWKTPTALLGGRDYEGGKAFRNGASTSAAGTCPCFALLKRQANWQRYAKARKFTLYIGRIG